MLKKSLGQRCEDILFTSSMESFRQGLFKFADDYDFPAVGGLIIIDHSPTLTEFNHISRIPPAYRPEMHLGRIDPVMQFCKKSREPIVWDAGTYISDGKAHLWENQASFDLRSGIALAMHMPRGHHFMIGLAGSRRLHRGTKTLESTVSDLREFIVCAQAAAFEIHTRGPSQDVDPDLSRHDLDLLRMCMSGWPSSAIAEKMCLPQEVVKLRLHRVAKKLGCSTRYQAVLRAIRLGLLSY